VSNPALIAALAAGRIAGAGLDVVDGEPAVPGELLASERVLFTPHIAGRSPAALQKQLEMLCANLEAFLASKPAPSAVRA
jgi:phosphoglycerate dehydrogenase-like enzyme